MSSIRPVYDMFEWSDREYPMQEFLERYERYAPFLLMVEEGYTGRDDWIHMIPNNDIFWFHGIARQPRIVVEDRKNRVFSIPECYPAKIIPTTHMGKDGPVMTVADMIKDMNYTRFRFAGEGHHTVYHGADRGDWYVNGVLNFIDRYDEKYLVLHTTVEAEAYGSEYMKDCGICRFGKERVAVFNQFTIIPAYVPITIVVAVGLTEDSDRAFQRGIVAMKLNTEKYEHNYTSILKNVADMLVFDKSPANRDYEFIHRTLYEKVGARHEVTSELYTSIDDFIEQGSHRDKCFGTKAEKLPKRPKKHKTAHNSKGKAGDRGKSRLPDPPEQDDEKILSDTSSLSPSLLSSQSDSSQVSLETDVDIVLSELVRIIKDGSVPPPSPPRSERVVKHKDPEGDGTLPPPVIPRERKDPNVPRVPERKAYTPKRSVSPPSPPSANDNRNSWKDQVLNTISSAHSPAQAIVRPTPRPSEKRISELKEASKKGVKLKVSKSEPAEDKMNDCGMTNIDNINEVPTDLTPFSVQDISKCLKMLHMDDLVDDFAKCQVDGDLLLSLNEKILQEDFGLKAFQAVKLVRFAQDGWRPNDSTSAEVHRL